ncbi:MAG: phosphate ABC transporter ATP-binding protein [Pseudomonadota bacterium]
MHDTNIQGTVVWPAGRNSEPLIDVDRLSFWYGETQALDDVSFELYPQEILAFMGPSGCGKSTALKCLNRMHDDTRGARFDGRITMDGNDIHARDVDPPALRRRFGWVAQKPNPFARTVYENVAYGARLHGIAGPGDEMDAHVESCLRRAHLWDEVKDELHTMEGPSLSGGQQQRLCVARALGYRPDVLLMDEPTGSIDPLATAGIEELMLELREDHAVVVITHSLMQAKRVADRVAHFHLGRLVEIGPTEQVFGHPRHPETKRFLQGKFG